MTATIETLTDGTEALVIVNGTNVEIHRLGVIASYQELLGEQDPAQTVVLMQEAMKRKGADQIDWAPLYGGLGATLSDFVDADVPPSEWVDALSGAEVPRKVNRANADKRAAMKGKQQEARTKILGKKKPGKSDTAEFAGLLAKEADKIKGHRVRFLQGVAPEEKRNVPQVTEEQPPLQRKSAVGRPTAE